MNSKTNEILNDIIHTASQAIIAEDEAIKRQAMGDIIDALASVIPSERIYKTPAAAVDFITANVPFSDCGRACRTPVAYKAKHIYINACDCKAMSISAGNRKVVGMVTKEDGLWNGDIYVNGELVADVYLYNNRGKTFTAKATEGAMRGILSHILHHKREKNNKRLREGVLTPEEELADTIARQKEEA